MTLSTQTSFEVPNRGSDPVDICVQEFVQEFWSWVCATGVFRTRHPFLVASCVISCSGSGLFALRGWRATTPGRDSTVGLQLLSALSCLLLALFYAEEGCAHLPGSDVELSADTVTGPRSRLPHRFGGVFARLPRFPKIF